MTTAIEWTDRTWNPTVGCTHVSAGCDNCYAARQASGRLSHLPAYQGLAVGGKFTGEVRTLDRRLDQPLKWTRPRRIFVNSMSDLFHDSVPDEFIASVFVVMAAASQHTFQVLTKRHARMRSLLASPEFQVLAGRAAFDFIQQHQRTVDWTWPLPNVWIGVSVEDQRWADIRIPALLDTPAAVRFLSCEPLLGPVDLDRWLPRPFERQQGGYWLYGTDPHGADKRWMSGPSIGWCIVGGESGPRARPMHPDWARSLRDQCTAAGIPFLFKQWGEWGPAPWSLRIPEPAAGWHGVNADWLAAEKRKAEAAGATHHIMDSGHLYQPDHKPWSLERDPDGDYPGAVRRWGKKTAGRELDGRTWDEYPYQNHGGQP